MVNKVQNIGVLYEQQQLGRAAMLSSPQGRRHQIRTHLAHIGAASVADGMLSAKPGVFMDGFSCSHFNQHPKHI